MSVRVQFVDDNNSFGYLGAISKPHNSNMLCITDGTTNRIDLSDSGFVSMCQAAREVLPKEKLRQIALSYLKYVEL